MDNENPHKKADAVINRYLAREDNKAIFREIYYQGVQDGLERAKEILNENK